MPDKSMAFLQKSQLSIRPAPRTWKNFTERLWCTKLA